MKFFFFFLLKVLSMDMTSRKLHKFYNGTYIIWVRYKVNYNWKRLTFFFVDKNTYKIFKSF